MKIRICLDMSKGYDLGANYYMTKPFTKAQLLYGLKLMFDETPEEIRVEDQVFPIQSVKFPRQTKKKHL